MVESRLAYHGIMGGEAAHVQSGGEVLWLSDGYFTGPGITLRRLSDEQQKQKWGGAQRMQKWLFAYVNDQLPPAYSAWDLGTYPATGDQAALERCHAFIRAWDGRRGLGLISPGSKSPGKTGLMVGVYKALFSQVARQGKEGAFMLSQELFTRSQTPAACVDLELLAFQATVLVIDDLGGEVQITPQSLALFHRMLVYRRKHSSITCFTSRLSLDELARHLSAPVLTLLCDHCEIITVTGPSLHAYSA